MNRPKVISIGFAVPPESFTQRESFDSLGYPSRFWSIFNGAGIGKRHLWLPMGTELSWQEATEQYKKGALYLSKEVIESCLDGRDPSTCGSVSFASCFPPDTLIEIGDGQKKRIVEIKEGDEVVTHLGKLRRVKRTFQRTYNGNLRILRLHKFGLLISATPEHPILSSESVRCKDIVHSRQYLSNKHYARKIQLGGSLGFTEINKLNCDNFIASKILYGDKSSGFFNQVLVDEDLACLFGWYLAEGHLSRSKKCLTGFSRIIFSLNSEEIKTEIFLKRVMREKFGLEGKSYLEGSNLRVGFSSTTLARKFYDEFGTGSSSKRVPPLLWNSDDTLIKSLLKGWLNGDGSIKHGEITASTICRPLALQLYQLLVRIGFRPNLRVRKSFTGKKGVNHKESYHFSINGPGISSLFGAPVHESSHLWTTEERNGQLFFQVKEISETEFHGLVYNLEVEEDNSYIADGISSHNCTGYECPSIIHHLAGELHFAPDIVYTSILGHGCEGGFPALRRAYDYVVAHNKPALAVSCEICSVDFFPEDGANPDTTNDYELLRANAIFGDGASAVLLGFDDDWRHPYLLDFESYFDPANMHHLGFTWEEGRLRVMLSKLVPKIAPLGAKIVVDRLLQRHNLNAENIQWWVIHPGGKAVLDNIRDVIGLPEEKLSMSREALMTYGNCSSSSIGIVGKLLMGREIKPNDYIMVISLGAGLAAGATLLRFGGE